MLNFLKVIFFQNVKDNNFDIIVSNPPYIDEVDMKTLEKELSLNLKMLYMEEKMDCFFYREIITNSLNYLSDNGILAFEIGYNQMEDISNLLIDNGFEIFDSKKKILQVLIEL